MHDSSNTLQIEEIKKMEQNISKIYFLKFVTMFLILMPVLVPFFQTIGITMKGVYLLQSIFAITVFILEIPSGYVSDLLGRKKTLIISSILKAIGFSMFPFAKDLNFLIFAEIILGIGVSLYSGTDIALLYDTLEAINSKKAHVKILGKSLYYFSLGEALASFIASLLLLLSFSIYNLAVISAVMSWIPLFIIFTIKEPPREKMTLSHKENIRYIIKSLFKQSKLLNLIIINSIFSFTGTLFAVWMFQKYWQTLHIPIIYFGFLWAITNFTVSISSKQAHLIEKKWGSSKILIVIGLLPIAGYFGISVINNILGFLACLLFQFCRGLGQVILKDALNRRVSADFRATANSITQMGTRIFFAILGPLLGTMIDVKGISKSAFSMSIIYILIFILIMLPLIRQRENFIKIKK